MGSIIDSAGKIFGIISKSRHFSETFSDRGYPLTLLHLAPGSVQQIFVMIIVATVKEKLRER